MIPLEHYLMVSAALFSLGFLGVLTRKNAVNVLMSIELIFNSANINLVAFSRFSSSDLSGQILQCSSLSSQPPKRRWHWLSFSLSTGSSRA